MGVECRGLSEEARSDERQGGEIMEDIYIGTPNAKQDEFLRCKKKYVAFGGARGGGKSWAVGF